MRTIIFLFMMNGSLFAVNVLDNLAYVFEQISEDYALGDYPLLGWQLFIKIMI